MDKDLKILKQKWINQEISYIKCGDSNGIPLFTVIGVYLKHDDGTAERKASFLTNLGIIENIIDENP